MVSSVADIFGSGNASTIGRLAMGFYTLSTVLAAIQGIAVAIVFAYLLDSNKGDTNDDDGVEIEMICPEDLGTLTVLEDGTTMCLQDGQPLASSDYQDFHLRDIDHELIIGVIIKQSLVDQNPKHYIFHCAKQCNRRFCHPQQYISQHNRILYWRSYSTAAKVT